MKPTAKRINKTQNPAPQGLRYAKEDWGPLVKRMLDAGRLYREIADTLGVSTSTVTRYVWENRWVCMHTHRTTTRTQILKANGKA